ncbi:ead/Ea22-like family protein [Pseudomonas aeruginosa]
MTDHAELRRVAALAHPDAEWFIARNLDHPNIDKPAASFIATATPKAVLALLDEIDGLSDELSACTEHPGGCGYWREAAKRRAEERDRLRAQNDALRGALQAVVDDPTWRSNDNTLWPKIIKAMDKGATK